MSANREREPGERGPVYQLESIDAVRDRIVNAILVILSIMGLPSILISLPRMIEFGFGAVQIFIYALYLILIGVAIFRRRISLPVRSYFLLCISFFIGVVALVDWGLIGMGLVFLMANIFLAVILLGNRVGAAFVSFAILAMAGIALGVHLDIISFDFDQNRFAVAPFTWITAILHIISFGILILMALSRFHGALMNSIDVLKKRSEELAESNQLLEIQMEERWRAQESLRESEEKYRGLFESSPESIAILDMEGNILDGNEFFGFSKKKIKEMMGKNFRDIGIIPPEYMDYVDMLFPTIAAGKEIAPVELKILLENKEERWIEVYFSLLKKRDKPYAIQIISRDITDRKNLEEQLFQSQKMEAIGRLAGGVAHDFNNQLLVIMNISEILGNTLSPDDPRRVDIDMIRAAGERSASLTRQLLSFSRKQVIEPKILKLDETVSDLEKMLRRLIGEDIDLRINTDPELGYVKADPAQVEQVIINLAVNARDAMPLGGKLTIETVNITLEEEYAKIHLSLSPGRYVMLAVTDTGHGMDEDTQSHIFEPFYTTKKRDKGTGLGLSTVYGIVKQCEGDIHVYSEPERGTTFKIYLPRVDYEDVEYPEHEKIPAESLRGSETILVVEDEQGVRKMLVDILSEKGYKVLETGSGQQALKMCKESKDEIHLLLTDVIMPEISGRELADKCQSIRPEIKVIFISGYTDNAIAHHGVLEPGTNFLQKPFSIESLLIKVREVL